MAQKRLCLSSLISLIPPHPILLIFGHLAQFFSFIQQTQRSLAIIKSKVKIKKQTIKFSVLCDISSSKFIIGGFGADLSLKAGTGRDSQSAASCPYQWQHRVWMHESFGRRSHFEWTGLGETVIFSVSVSVYLFAIEKYMKRSKKI